MKIQKVLFPTDFSSPADIARPHAFELAHRFGAELTTLHVASLFTDDPKQIALEMDEEQEEDGLIHKMHDMLSGIETPSVPVRYRVIRDISPAAGILDFLNDNAMDLVVMGTHGRSALAHFLLGSVAERVVRHANCPVLTVGHARRTYTPHYKNILVPFDFSTHSKQAIRVALALARRFEAKVKVLNVIEQEIHPAYYDVWRESIEKALPDIRRDAEDSLKEALHDEAAEKLELHVNIGEGKAHREIVDFADKNTIDLIVMATHGLSGLEHVLLGSTTERVVRLAHCPVLTFKLED